MVTVRKVKIQLGGQLDGCLLSETQDTIKFNCKNQLDTTEATSCTSQYRSSFLHLVVDFPRRNSSQVNRQISTPPMFVTAQFDGICFVWIIPITTLPNKILSGVSSSHYTGMKSIFSFTCVGQ
jgi:hypothetical protein